MNNADSADGQPSEDYAKFMEDFKKGFSTGYDASTQYGQKSNPSNGEPAATQSHHLLPLHLQIVL